MAYTGTDSSVGIREAVGPDALVDNEELVREDLSVVQRQRVSDPRAEDLLEAILATLKAMARAQGLPDPSTGANRVTVLSGSVSVSTVTTVTSVTTVSNLQQVDGFRAALVVPTISQDAARALYRNISFT